MKLKKGDKVIVIAGKNKGEQGSIVKVLLEKDRIVVSGIAKIKKHQRSRKTNESGSVVERESAIHASNVLLVDPKTGKGTRLGKKKVGEKLVRIAKKSGQEI